MSLEIVRLISMHGPHVWLILVTVDGPLFRFVQAVVCRGLEIVWLISGHESLQTSWVVSRSENRGQGAPLKCFQVKQHL